jgi:hypothetical protein
MGRVGIILVECIACEGGGYDWMVRGLVES